MKLWPLCAVVLAASIAQPIQAAVLVPYGACGWQHVALSSGYDYALFSSPGQGADWPVACAPFVAAWGCSPPGTAVNVTGHVFMRRVIVVPPGEAVGVQYKVRGIANLTVWHNGLQRAGSSLSDECPLQPNREFEGSFFMQPGPNMVLFGSYYGESYNEGQVVRHGGHLDVSLSSDQLVSASSGSWGRLKIRYR